MSLPIHPRTLPAVLDGQSNGRLPASLLHAVTMPGGGRDALLVEPAARCFRAMVAAAAHDGIPLMCTEGYRDYATQERLFRDRFRTYNTGRTPAVTRTWLGQTWWLRPGVALAAVPGTSNHGWGLAADLSEQRDTDPEPESISPHAVDWLVANEYLYGISHEVPSEPWHVRAYVGDNIPAAVLAYESTQEDDMRHFIVDTSKPQGSQPVYEWVGTDPATGLQALIPVVKWDPVKLLIDAGRAATVDVHGIDPTWWVIRNTAPALGDVNLSGVLAALDHVQATVDRLVASEKAQAKALGE